jgi:hypothetical protein
MTKERNILCNNWEYVDVQKRSDKTEDVPLFCNENKLRGLVSASELYRLSDRRLSAKLVQTLAGRECRVVRATNPHGR